MTAAPAWLTTSSWESVPPEQPIAPIITPFSIYITSFPAAGAKWQVSSDGGIAPKWRHDGKELFFLDPLENIVAVDVNTSGNAVNLGAPHTL
jgi:hypothetical protein